MAPKNTTAGSASRGGRLSKTTSKPISKSKGKGKVDNDDGGDGDGDGDDDGDGDVDPFVSLTGNSAAPRANEGGSGGSGEPDDGVEEDGTAKKETAEQQIPPELLTRILHAFFQKEGTKITRDANEAVAKYMEIFTREAVVRAAAERKGAFLEVEDLEKVSPQLLLDL